MLLFYFIDHKNSKCKYNTTFRCSSTKPTPPSSTTFPKTFCPKTSAVKANPSANFSVTIHTHPHKLFISCHRRAYAAETPRAQIQIRKTVQAEDERVT